MTDRMSQAMIATERRVFSLERRFRDFASRSVKYLYQLLDVDVTYEGPGAVADGDVLTYDAGEEKWIAGSGGGGGGPYASVSVTGLYDGTTVTGQVTEWQSHTTGYTIAVGSGGRGIDVDLQPTVAGVYQVSGSVEVTAGSGNPKVTVAMFGGSIDQWRIVGDAETCREPITAHDDGDLGGAVSLLMPLGDAAPPSGGVGVYIDIDVGSASEVRWRLQAHYVHPIAVTTGECGG